jgi:hypothetical protein
MPRVERKLDLWTLRSLDTVVDRHRQPLGDRTASDPGGPAPAYLPSGLRTPIQASLTC